MARPKRARKRDARLTYKALAELFRRVGPSQRVAGTSAYTLDHLRRFFERRLPESSTIVTYVRRRQKEGAAIQTINEELWALAWMFQCAVQQGKLKEENCPTIEFLGEPRTELARALEAHTRAMRHEAFRAKIRPPEPRPARRRAGRPPKLTDEEFQRHEPERPLSDRARANFLSSKLQRHVSEDQVRRTRGRLQVPAAFEPPRSAK
jgi:hypothetical protein